MLSAAQSSALKSNKNQGNLMNYLTTRAKAKKVLILSGLLLVFAQIFAGEGFAQRRKLASKSAKKQIITKKAKPTAVSTQNINLPKVTQINEVALRQLLKREDPNSKPLLVNFWATWCDPCREEFPDLVKLDADYKDKIDLITISLDDLSEINGDVPKFLAEMKAEMPSYLLKTPNEEAAIASVSKSWQGGLPFTILFNGKGETAYFIQGKFKVALLRAEIDKTIEIQARNASDSDIQQKLIARREIEESETPYRKGKNDAQKDILSEKLQILRYGEQTSEKSKLKEHLKVKYGVEMLEIGCKVSTKLLEYVKGYNEFLEAEIKRRYGINILEGIF